MIYLLYSCNFSTAPFCADGGDLCQVDNSKLATACSRLPQLLPCFSEASHAAKTVLFLSASLLKVNKLQPPPLNLEERPKVDDNDF